MKKVTIKGISPNYPVEGSIESVIWFIGTDFKKERFDDSKYERRVTGARIISRHTTEKGDTVIFEISDQNAEIFLPVILKGWNKRNVKIEEVIA